MLVICEECGLKYEIDTSKIIGDRAKFKCKGCGVKITVNKEESMSEGDLAALEEALLSSAPTGTDKDSELSDNLGLSGDKELLADAQAASTGGQESPSPQMVQQPKKKRSGLGLTSKVVFLMLLVSLLPVATFFGISFKQTNDRIIRETNRSGALVSNLLTSEVDEWLDKNIRALKAMAKIPAITSMNQFDQEFVLRSLQTEYSWMYLTFTTDVRGVNVARSDGKPLTDYSNRDYVKDVVGGADVAWQNLIGKTSKEPALVLAVPIKDGETVIGVLAAAMTRDTLSKLVTSFRLGSTGSSFLVDQDAKAVAHLDNAFVTQQKNMSSHPLVKSSGKGQTKWIEFIDANGKEVIGFGKKTKLGWTLAIQQEKSEAFEAIKNAQMFAYSLFAVTVVVILLIAYFASRSIVTPIRKLTDAANRISVGELDVEIKNSSKDEIGDLADAIMRMQDSISLSISRLKRRRR